MNLYYSLYTKSSKINDKTVLATHRVHQGKHFVTLDEQKVQVFTAKQQSNNRLFYNGVAITDESVLATHRVHQGKHFVTLDEQTVKVLTAVQKSNNRLFYNGVVITDESVLATHTVDKGKHFVTLYGQKVQVFTAVQQSNNRLFYNGQAITDEYVLATHTVDKGKHFITLDGQTVEVSTSKQYYNNRLFYNGKAITNKSVLATHTVDQGKHFVTLDSRQKVQVFTSKQQSNNRLFYNGRAITDEYILATHIMNKGKHFVTLDGQTVQVFTALHKAMNRLFYNGRAITDESVLATHRVFNREHFVTLNGQTVQVCTAAQQYKNRLLYKGKTITDESVLATHIVNEGKHFVTIDGQTVQVFTASHKYNNRLFYNGKAITDESVLATHTVYGRKHFVTLDGQAVQVLKAAKRSNNHVLYDNTEKPDSLFSMLPVNAPHNSDEKAHTPDIPFIGIKDFNTSLANMNAATQQESTVQKEDALLGILNNFDNPDFININSAELARLNSMLGENDDTHDISFIGIRDFDTSSANMNVATQRDSAEQKEDALLDILNDFDEHFTPMNLEELLSLDSILGENTHTTDTPVISIWDYDTSSANMNVATQQESAEQKEDALLDMLNNFDDPHFTPTNSEELASLNSIVGKAYTSDVPCVGIRDFDAKLNINSSTEQETQEQQEDLLDFLNTPNNIYYASLICSSKQLEYGADGVNLMAYNGLKQNNANASIGTHGRFFSTHGEIGTSTHLLSKRGAIEFPSMKDDSAPSAKKKVIRKSLTSL